MRRTIIEFEAHLCVEAEGKTKQQWADEILEYMLDKDIACSLHEPRDEEIERLQQLAHELRDWFRAYPVDIFTPLQGDPIKKTGDYDTKEKRTLITRASAAMARHMIERIPEKIRAALDEAHDD